MIMIWPQDYPSLTSSPPDESLKKSAAKGKLDPVELEAQVRRLFKHYRIKNFLSSFTGQWLDLNAFDIMPDSRLLKRDEKDLAAIIAETELLVARSFGKIIRSKPLLIRRLLISTNEMPDSMT